MRSTTRPPRSAPAPSGDNEPHLYLGTSSWIAAHVPRKKTDVFAGIASVPCAVPDRYLMTALQATAGANLTWLRDKIVEYDDPLLSAGHLSRDEGTIFDAFDKIIPTVPAGRQRSALHALALRRTRPCRRPEPARRLPEHLPRHQPLGPAAGGLRGRRAQHPLAGRRRSTGSSARRSPRMVITGGGARSDSWCQIFADVLGIEIRRDAQPVAVNARGAGWIGAVGRRECSRSPRSRA